MWVEHLQSNIFQAFAFDVRGMWGAGRFVKLTRVAFHSSERSIDQWRFSALVSRPRDGGMNCCLFCCWWSMEHRLVSVRLVCCCWSGYEGDTWFKTDSEEARLIEPFSSWNCMELNDGRWVGVPRSFCTSFSEPRRILCRSFWNEPLRRSLPYSWGADAWERRMVSPLTSSVIRIWLSVCNAPLSASEGFWEYFAVHESSESACSRRPCRRHSAPEKCDAVRQGPKESVETLPRFFSAVMIGVMSRLVDGVGHGSFNPDKTSWYSCTASLYLPSRR